MENRRILIVDDDVGVAAVFRLVLENMGNFTVRLENLGVQALRTAREFRPDLIFLDFCLPDKGGSQIASEVRADSDLGAVPIVMVTGMISEEEAENGYAGFPALAKPVSPMSLISCARNALARAAWRS